MNKSEQKLIYGIGSPNGDDQIGWRVIERIRSRLPDGWHAKSGVVPMDLLNHLEDICEVHIVDACEGEEEIGTTHRFVWPEQQLQYNSATTSHDFSLKMTLELADSLGILPKTVTIWGIVGKMFGPNDTVNLSEGDFERVLAAIQQVIRQKDNAHA
ncbi:MAG: hydrogenase maturation protease [Pirellula sp.]|jgi:hydrogenase maturation protease